MSIKIGDMDLANEIIDLRYQLTRTQMIIDKINEKNKTIGITKSEMEEIEEKVIEIMQQRYPRMGIKKVQK